MRRNQTAAVEASVKSNFSSGIHAHATGTGKSWIALDIVRKFSEANPASHVMWLCEQKSILTEQFNRSVITERGFGDIFKRFMVIDHAQYKTQTWVQNVRSACAWKKPILLIINRAFLVSKERYSSLDMNFGLIIHDECHTVTNNTTKAFYEYTMKRDPATRCIGFSATPETTVSPFDNIITHYSIYEAFRDGTIVKPVIRWIKSEDKLSDLEIAEYCKQCIVGLPYRKVIVWCGMIEHCDRLAELWSHMFQGYMLACDTSRSSNPEGFDAFAEAETNAILFCACKHREGSDIKNLDACVFLDGVQDRTPRTFVQCIGRVLRKDKQGLKQHGLIIDLKASSCIKICDRMNQFLNHDGTFPWDYTFHRSSIGGKSIVANRLELVDRSAEAIRRDGTKDEWELGADIAAVAEKFVKALPEGEAYRSRLTKELRLIHAKKLCAYLLRAVEILELTQYIPHVTRGSCGSSLVCFLLGISNVDPILHNIKFERFLNEFRDTLPDIDLDFPHYLRDEVFMKLELRWPNKVARISNHVCWHEKSATREALRRAGITQRVPKETLNHFVTSLPAQKKKEVMRIAKELNNTFRHYSLHCGGVIFFPDGVPEELKMPDKNAKTLTQIIYDKNDVSRTKNFKIDVLSSRGISQLMDVVCKDIDFADCAYDKRTYDMLCEGDNIGVTLAESPLMRRALLKLQPRSITDLAICLAIIRPAAKDARLEVGKIPSKDKIIFDDDVIEMLADKLSISYDLADKFRRCLCKSKWTPDDKSLFDRRMAQLTKEERGLIHKSIENLRAYGFCKSHSYSYAQLVYKLAREKAYQPRKFWLSTIKNNESSYRKWVHLYEARRAGVDVMSFLHRTREQSIYAENKKKCDPSASKLDQLRKFGHWFMSDTSFPDGCYMFERSEGKFAFSGIIASLRVISYDAENTIAICISPGPGVYINITVKTKFFKPSTVGIKGTAVATDGPAGCYQALSCYCF